MNKHLLFASAGASGGILPLLVFLAIWLILIIGVWKVFVKGGQPGWACLIPIYNLYCGIRIAGKEWWWLLLLLVPLANIIVAIVLVVAISRNFGKGGGFAAGLVLLPWIFYPILGFGTAHYQKPPSLGTA